MTIAETKEVIKLIGELFLGQVTESVAKLIREDLGEYPKAMVMEAIKEHRRTREMLSYPQLIEGVRSVKRRQEHGQTTTKNEGSLADVFRRTHPWLAGVPSDAEVIVRKYRQDWHCGWASDGYRRGISHSCASALKAECGMDEATADSWANVTDGAIFEVRPDFFLQCLNELRGARASAVMAGQDERW